MPTEEKTQTKTKYVVLEKRPVSELPDSFRGSTASSSFYIPVETVEADGADHARRLVAEKHASKEGPELARVLVAVPSRSFVPKRVVLEQRPKASISAQESV